MMGSQSSRIAAYKMGVHFTGCEIDKHYFAKGEERFQSECLGITRLPNGMIETQTKLFEL
jgi:site-specific DNA-methyltransferase (adenine-specific)